MDKIAIIDNMNQINNTKKINKIVKAFDFEKVYRYILQNNFAINHNNFVDVDMLKKQAILLLQRVIKKDNSIEYDKYLMAINKNNELSLYFYIENVHLRSLNK
jgi:hypothetical protein